MRLLLILLAFLGVLLLFAVALKNTVFEFSIVRKRFAGILFARELLFAVLFGAILFEVTDTQFLTFYTTDQSIEETTPIVFFAVAFLLFCIGIFSRTIFKKYLQFNLRDEVGNDRSPANSTTILDTTALFLFAMLGLSLAMGANHAFIANLSGGIDLLQARMENVYENNGPAFLMGYARIGTTLLAVLLGFFGQAISRRRQVSYFLLLTFAATFPGDKAPLINAIFLFYISRLTVANYSARKIIVAAAITGLISVAIIYLLTKIQFPEKDFDNIIEYLIGRLGVGQIFGVYEQFALRLQDYSYITNEISFSGIFGYNNSYAKDLMMLTGAYGMRPEDIGVMNSLFIGEAMAIGGMPLVYISPVIVAFNFTLLAHMTIGILARNFNISIWYSKRIGAIFVAAIAVFTGDFGGLLFFKKLIALAIFWVGLYFLNKFLEIIKKISLRLKAK